MSASIIILIATFFGLSMARVPVGIAMLSGGLIYLIYTGKDPGVAADQVVTGLMQSDVLLAVPMFILVGNIVSGGSIAVRLMDFAQVIVGRFRGGFALVSVIVNVVFASMSGSAVADAAGPGAAMVRMMRQSGYPGGFAAMLIAAGSTVAPVIPPSIPFILYAAIANVSVGALFIAGILPGIIIAVAIMVAVLIHAHLRDFPKMTREGGRGIASIVLRSLLPLVLPVLILGGIRIGAFTPTEGSAVACIYALVLVAVIYREASPRHLFAIFANSLVQSAAVLTVIMGAFLINYAIAAEQVPLHVAAWFARQDLPPAIFLGGVMLLFLLMGLFLDTTIMLLVLVPVLLPTANLLHIDLVHFGLVIVVNMMIGMITPPYGVLLFVIARVSSVPMAEIVRESWSFIIILILCLAAFVYLPDISLYLPRAAGLVR